MTSTFPFLSPNNLSEFQMIGGTSQKLYFDIYTSASAPVNLAGATCIWRMSYFGSIANAYLQKTAIISGSPVNRIEVDLEPADTAAINGKFLHQIIVQDTSGSVFIPSQGIVTIVGKIGG